MTTLGIVTPYYQKVSGVLRRTAESVAAQTAAPGSLSVIWSVIDDGSPINASAELADFHAPGWLDVRIERTANRGISAARNRSLDILRGGCDYIAFLDSDDTWAPSHAERAITALGKGYDFYFSDYVKLGEDRSTFDLFNFQATRRPGQPDDLLFVDSDSIFDAIVKTLRKEVASNVLHGLRRDQWRGALALGAALRSDKRTAKAIVRSIVSPSQ